MKFLSAALKLIFDDNEKDSRLIEGARHSDCYKYLNLLKRKKIFPLYQKVDIVEGFTMLDDNSNIVFVDRYKGAEIAIKLGYHLEYPNCLYSEDLW